MFRFCSVIAALSLGFVGCSPRDETIEIKIGNSRFEQIPAGAWLNDFQVSYLPGADKPKAQILKKLRAEGSLRDEYQYRENGKVITTREWTYHGYRIQERYYQSAASEGAAAVTISVEFPDGIPFFILILSRPAEEQAQTLLSASQVRKPTKFSDSPDAILR